MTPTARKTQSGSVLMLTMWTIVLLSMLVLVMASEVRLSAELSKSQIDRTDNWADTLTALNAAEMELLLETMPPPAEDVDPEDDDDIKNPDFRFNGQPLDLIYDYPETMEVRIYDHAGKINLRNLTEDKLRLLLENMMEEVDDDEIEELLAAWGDWIDEDDGVRNEGAEDDYYLSLDPPYLPRQGQLESVEELLLIRGFEKYFADVNLGAAFTLYSEGELVNLNTASREALALLPGLDSTAIDAILTYRNEQDFTDLVDLEDIVSQEDLVELQNWIDFTSVSQTYTVLVVPRQLLGKTTDGEDGDEEAADPAGLQERKQPKFGGFSKIIRVPDYNERPVILRVDPMPRLPDLE